MPKIAQKQGNIIVSCWVCVNLPLQGNSMSSMCNLIDQHHLTQIIFALVTLSWKELVLKSTVAPLGSTKH